MGLNKTSKSKSKKKEEEKQSEAADSPKPELPPKQRKKKKGKKTSGKEEGEKPMKWGLGDEEEEADEEDDDEEEEEDDDEDDDDDDTTTDTDDEDEIESNPPTPAPKPGGWRSKMKKMQRDGAVPKLGDGPAKKKQKEKAREEEEGDDGDEEEDEEEEEEEVDEDDEDGEDVGGNDKGKRTKTGNSVESFHGGALSDGRASTDLAASNDALRNALDESMTSVNSDVHGESLDASAVAREAARREQRATSPAAAAAAAAASGGVGGKRDRSRIISEEDLDEDDLPASRGLQSAALQASVESLAMQSIDSSSEFDRPARSLSQEMKAISQGLDAANASINRIGREGEE